MDFPGYQLPEELRMLQRTVRRFMQEEIVPLEQGMDPEAIELDHDNWERLAKVTQDAGLWALAAPRECGGGGLGTFGYTVLLEEMAQHRHEASIAKLYSSEVLGRVVDRAIQIHGGYGVAKELPLERWYREARVHRIGEGPSEVQRFVISRNLLRD